MDLSSKKKKLAWLLRDGRFCSDKDENDFVKIKDLLEKYYDYEKQKIKEDAYYCHYVWKPHDRNSYAKFNSIDQMIRNKFVMPCQYIEQEQFDIMVNDFIEKYMMHFANLSFEDCIQVQTIHPDQFLIDKTKTKIRAIRSWEKK